MLLHLLDLVLQTCLILVHELTDLSLVHQFVPVFIMELTDLVSASVVLMLIFFLQDFFDTALVDTREWIKLNNIL